MMNHLRQLIYFILSTAAYLILARSGLLLASINESASPLWPASGFAVALIYVRRRYWISIFFGALLANYLPDQNLAFAASVAMGNTLEGLVGAVLFQTSIKNFTTQKKIAFAIGLSLISIIAPLFSSTLGVLSLLYWKDLNKDLAFKVLETWWIGDSIGILVFFLPFRYIVRRVSREISRVKYELKIYLRPIFVIAAGTILITSIVLIYSRHPSFAFLLFPVLLFSEYKVRAFGATTSLLFMSLTGAVISSMGAGLFSQGSMNERLLTFQLFLFSLAVTSLCLQIFSLEKYLKKTWKVLIIGWAVTALVVVFFVKQRYLAQQLEFTSHVDIFLNQLEYKMNVYISSLDAAKAFIKSSQHVDSVEWKSFISNHSVVSKYPGINGIGVIWPVKKENLPRFIEHQNKYNIYPFKIKDLPDKNSKTTNNDLYIISMFEPWTPDNVALGLNIGSEVNRRTAADLARDLGTPQMTNSIHLLGPQDDNLGFLLLVPFYKSTENPESVERRREQFWGWVYAPFTWNKFFSAFKKELTDFNFDLSSLSEQKNESLVYQKTEDANPYFNFQVSRHIELSGKKFLAKFRPSNSYKSNIENLLPWISFIGCIITMSVAFVIGALASVRFRAERIAQSRMEIIEKQQVELLSSAKLASLGEMAAGIAHEINNPLAIISTKASNIRTRFSNGDFATPKNEVDLIKIEQTAFRMAKIIKALRSYSRNGDSDPFQICDLNTIIMDTIDMIGAKFSHSGIELLIDLPKSPTMIECKSVQIFQVLINLFGNSFDSILELRQAPWIKIQVSQDSPKYVNIKITDSGNGIPPEIVEKIFHPFFTTKSVGKGTGLGLSISMNIINGHGGTIKYDSLSPNTCFIIQLPYKQTSSVKPPA